ncbi:MAG: EamA family transporter [Thermoleophilia bacterium]
MTSTPARWRVILAFAAVYIIWGTTYLAIRFAVETIPPFLMGGLRFLLAGILLYTWARLRGAGRPHPSQWRPALISSVFLILLAQGSVVWAEQYLASGLAAVLVSLGVVSGRREAQPADGDRCGGYRGVGRPGHHG